MPTDVNAYSKPEWLHIPNLCKGILNNAALQMYTFIYTHEYDIIGTVNITDLQPNESNMHSLILAA